MAEGLNRVMLLGNLGADPELRFGQGPDTAVLRLRLATTESYFDKRTNERKERTDWHSVVVFGKRGEALSKLLAKGSSIFVEGRLQTSSYDKEGQKHYRTDIVATNVILAGGRREGGGGQSDAPREREGRAQTAAPTGQRAPVQPAQPTFDDAFQDGGDDDSIPF